MSSRALRKAQREREEQERQKQLDEADEEDEQAPIAPMVKKSAFAMLDQEEEDKQLDSENETVESEEQPPTQEQSPEPSRAPASQKKRKKKKKARSGAVNVSESHDARDEKSDVDEIDQALKELSTSQAVGMNGETAAGIDQATQEACRLLAVDTHNLHAQNEMKRLFGRAALDQDDEADGAPHQGNVPGANRRQQRRVQQVGLAQALRGQRGQAGRGAGLAALSLRRNIFIQGKEEWPYATGGGLGMEVVEKQADGTVEYRYVHNKAYQDVQGQFESSVASMDPNRLVVLLQQNPYHISTLLQVSEIAKQERDHATSGDLLERALFSMGRAVHSTFAKNLAEGKARLDFRRPENREFWLASWRYMQNLAMRATWRTVYEWAKLLLSLSPSHDPYGMWLVLDQYALRSRQDLDYLNLSRASKFQDVCQNLPHVQFSQGLAEIRAGNKSKGKQVLFTAAGRFPWVVARLMQEMQMSPPPAIWGKEPRTEKEKLYTELYATRAKDIWNTPESSALLVEVASAVPPETSSAPVDDSEITVNEARQVLLSDVPALISLVPRKYTAALQSSSDPLPPSDNITTYTPSSLSRSMVPPRDEGSPADDLRELQGLYSFFSRLFPWFNQTREDPTDGAGEEEDRAAAHPSQEEIERRIEESGVSEEEVMQHTQRMMELQRRFLGDESVMEQAMDAINQQDDDDNRRARVEDAPNDDDD